MKILFISNGYGEDTIASYIINSLKIKAPEFKIFAFPLVGIGNNYKELHIPLIGPVKNLPSGGDLHSWQRIALDIKSGIFTLLLEQVFFLINQRRNFDLVVAVGDTFPVLMSVISGLYPIAFVGTAKSNWYYSYSILEKIIFRLFCEVVFTRDLPTSEDLRRFSINSLYAGNPMMDCFFITGEDFGIKSNDKIIGVLPGSREEAYRDFPVILDALEKLSAISSFTFLAALSPSIDIKRLPRNWTLTETQDLSKGIVGYLRKDSVELILTKGKFGDVINKAHIIIGQAGTGNEQSAGLGKPVVAFNPNPKKLDWYRGRQKGLLGDAISIVKPSGREIAADVIDILNNTNRMNYMTSEGKERMGISGGVDKIAQEILSLFS